MWREVLKSLFAPVISDEVYLPEEVRGVLLCELLEEVFGGAGNFKEIGTMCKLLSILSLKPPEHDIIKLKNHTQGEIKKSLDSVANSLQIIQPCSVIERLSYFGKSDQEEHLKEGSECSRMLADISINQSKLGSSAHIPRSTSHSAKDDPFTEISRLTERQLKVRHTIERCESRLRMELTTVFTILRTQSAIIAMSQMTSSRFSDFSHRELDRKRPTESAPKLLSKTKVDKKASRRINDTAGDSSRTGLSQADISAIHPLDISSCSQPTKRQAADVLTDEIEEFLKHEAETQEFLQKLAHNHGNILQDAGPSLSRSQISDSSSSLKHKPAAKPVPEAATHKLANQVPRKNDKRPLVK